MDHSKVNVYRKPNIYAYLATVSIDVRPQIAVFHNAKILVHFYIYLKYHEFVNFKRSVDDRIRAVYIRAVSFLQNNLLHFKAITHDEHPFKILELANVEYGMTYVRDFRNFSENEVFPYFRYNNWNKCFR